MSLKDIFGIVVRTIGLLTVLGGIYTLGTGLLAGLDVLILTAFVLAAIGVYLMKGAPGVIEWSYSPPALRNSDSDLSRQCSAV